MCPTMPVCPPCPLCSNLSKLSEARRCYAGCSILVFREFPSQAQILSAAERAADRRPFALAFAQAHQLKEAEDSLATQTLCPSANPRSKDTKRKRSHFTSLSKAQCSATTNFVPTKMPMTTKIMAMSTFRVLAQ